MNRRIIVTVSVGLTLLAAVAPSWADDGGAMDRAIAAQCPAAAVWHTTHPVRTTRHPQAVARINDPGLHKQLLDMVKADQDARHAWIKAGAQDPKNPMLPHMLAVDAGNLKQLKSIIAGNGFPTPAMVGNDGVQAAFVLVQHADSDPAFQASELPRLARLAAQDVVPGRDLALLTDRVLRAQDKPQRYGSQFAPDRLHPGRMAPEPMEDPARVDARRAAVGLMPLADYACVLSVVYRTPVSASPSAGAGGHESANPSGM